MIPIHNVASSVDSRLGIVGYHGLAGNLSQIMVNGAYLGYSAIIKQYSHFQ